MGRPRRNLTARESYWPYLIFLVILALYAFTPRDIEIVRDWSSPGLADHYDAIMIMHGWPRVALFFLAAAASIAMLIRGIYAAIGNRIAHCIISCVLAINLAPMAFVWAVVSHGLGPWTVYERAIGPDGREYCFLDCSFLQGQIMALTVAGKSGPLYHRYEVLGATNGDSPRSWMMVVRPSSFKMPAKSDPYGMIAFSPDGKVLGLRYSNHCYMMWDASESRFYGHDDIETISPFVLIRYEDDLYGPDVESLLTLLRERDIGPGVPSRETLTEALNHINPNVRVLARDILADINSD